MEAGGKQVLSRWLLIWLTLRLRRWRRHIHLKLLRTFNSLHGIISKSTQISITTAVRTSNPTCLTSFSLVFCYCLRHDADSISHYTAPKKSVKVCHTLSSSILWKKGPVCSTIPQVWWFSFLWYAENRKLESSNFLTVTEWSTSQFDDDAPSKMF
jgi:hypothetical protein